MQTSAQIKQNDVMRVGFAGHEKACYPQKRRRGHSRLRHNGTDASPWKIWFTASEHLPAQPSLDFSIFSSLVVTSCSSAALCVCVWGFFFLFFLFFLWIWRSRAGAQYGQLGLCAALPPSWMLLLASGCTASDVTSSSHPSILISGSKTGNWWSPLSAYNMLLLSPLMTKFSLFLYLKKEEF